MGVRVREKIKGSDDWWVFVNDKGKRTARHVGDYETAEKLAKLIRAKLALGAFAPPVSKVAVPTLRVYSSTWLSDHVAGILDDATHERYGYVMDRDILPAIGKLPVDLIEPKHVRNLINKLVKDGRTSKSISLTRTVLSSCLGEAVIDGLLKTNPVKALSNSRRTSKTVEARRPRKHKVNPFNASEVEQFVRVALTEDPDMYGPMFLCDFRTGLRLGELVALHWDDIDWEANVIIVQRSFKCNKKGDKNQKTKAVKDGEERRVDMSAQLRSVLLDLFRRRKLESAKSGSWNTSKIIFHYQGRYRAQNTVRKAFNVMLKKAGLRKIRVHDVRHTYASLLISNGVSLAYIRDQLGHSSIKTTVDIYGHLIPSSMQHVVNELDHAINESNPE